MKLLDRIFGREARASVKTSDPYLAEFFGMRGGNSDYVNPDRASGIATAQACISIISQSLASVPLSLYRKTANGGRDKATDYPLYEVLYDRAADAISAFELREMLAASLLVHGNAYALKIWNGRGQVVELRPLDHHNVAVERLESGRLRYRVSGARGGVQVYLQEEILHLRYRLARDGAMGISPIQSARETFALALAQQNTAGVQARKGFRPEGALIFPSQLSGAGKDVALSKLKDKIEAESSTSGVFVLDGGVEWRSFSFSSKDAEFLESRKLTNLDICRIWNVPPTAAGILDHGTYSNVEAESRALVVRCLAPMAKRIEQAMNLALLPDESRKTLFIEHDLQGLLRGDLQARYAAYRIGRDGGWLSSNDIRGWENMPEIDGGDEYLKPLNMASLGDPPVSPAKPA
jgi:HK97 family phage portal protein